MNWRTVPIEHCDDTKFDQVSELMVPFYELCVLCQRKLMDRGTSSQRFVTAARR